MTIRSLRALADKLAWNHFHTSIPDSVHTSPEAWEQVFGSGREATKPERTILILGSGASIATFGPRQFPGTAAAIQRIDARLGLRRRAMRGIEEIVSLRKGELAEAYGYGDAWTDFETHLATLAGIFSQERVSATLAELYGTRYRPHLVFELIAHMLKHRFIDVVINFNFDELLDQAIDAEMGTGEYHRIVSDGDCGELQRYLVDRRLKIPLYIKPHGTASQPTTMRFTKEHYHQLPPPLRRLMGDVLGGHSAGSEKDRSDPAYRPYPVNLITVGFGMKSLDLLSLIRSATTTFNVFHIDRREARRSFPPAAEPARWSAHYVAVEAHGGLSATVATLWKLVRARFRRTFRPRGIARHEIVHALFHSAPPGGGPGRRLPVKDVSYFRARLHVELALALARGNGQIDLSVLSETRVGFYFSRLWDAGEKPSIHDFLEAFGGGPTAGFIDAGRTIFRIHWEEAADAKEANEQLAADLWRDLAAALSRVEDPAFREHLQNFSASEPDFVRTRLRKLASSDAKDIAPDFHPSALILSRTPDRARVLHTSLGLTIRFVEMLNRPWDLMLVVSDLGKVVEKYFRHRKQGYISHHPREKHFCVVVTENDRPSIARARLRRLGRRRLRFRGQRDFRLGSQRHAHHMILLMRRTADELRAVAGISYRKSGIHNRVNPVYLEEGSRDIEDALACFQQYVFETLTPTRRKAGGSPEAVWKAMTAPLLGSGTGAAPAGMISLGGMEFIGEKSPGPA